MTRLQRMAAISCYCSLLLAFAHGEVNQKVTVNALKDAQKDAIDKFVDSFMSTNHTPGLEIAVMHGAKTLYECGYGTTALKIGSIPGPDTHFQIDSLTKAFTAFAVLCLVDEGKVNLDHNMGEYHKLPNSSWEKIPVRAYLGMITGIPDGGTTSGSYKEVIENAAKKPGAGGVGLDFEPGSKYEYSNTNYFILGDMIAAVSGSSYSDFVTDKVLKRLNLTETGLKKFGLGPLWATPYLNGKEVSPRLPEAGFSGGGFTSTMRDLEAFAVGLNYKYILSTPSFDAMWAPTVRTSGPNKGDKVIFGLGWDIADDSTGALELASKGGGGWGWSSMLDYFAKDNDFVIVLRNSGGPPNLHQVAVGIHKALNGS